MSTKQEIYDVALIAPMYSLCKQNTQAFAPSKYAAP